MKILYKTWTILFMSIMTYFSCTRQEANLSETCFEGIIPYDSLYKMIYNNCYNKSLWIEVLNNDTLGKDVKIPCCSPVLYPCYEVNYSNIIEVPIPEILLTSNYLDTLLGKKIYFQCREAEESEITLIRNTGCQEVYEVYSVPVVILTNFSFSECPETSDK